METQPSRFAMWWARIAVAFVFVANVQCAVQFLVTPEGYLGAFELAGVAGTVAIQGIAVAFLMWNVTYPLVIINPYRYRVVFGIVLVQQLVGLVGESFIFSTIGAGYDALTGSIARFIAFDAFGLVLMAVSAVVLFVSASKRTAKAEAS